MTSRLQAVSARTGGSRLTRAGALVVAFGLAFALLLPEQAQAQWGKLEKLSGPGPFTGFVYEFRVACFGPPVEGIAYAESLTAHAVSATQSARVLERDTEGPNWAYAAEAWDRAATAWAEVVGDTHDPVQAGSRDRVERAERQARSRRRRAYEEGTATSSVGVFWSFCNPNKDRRVALDVGVSTLRASGRDVYAGGAPIKLDTLMTSVSWRLLAETKADVLDVSTGGGVYWFSSSGFPSKSGVVLQPIRFTFRAPPSWSSAESNSAKRWAAVPSYAFALTMFPAGFEPGDFAGTGDSAVRLPREIIATHYFFVSVQPLLQLLRK